MKPIETSLEKAIQKSGRVLLITFYIPNTQSWDFCITPYLSIPYPPQKKRTSGSGTRTVHIVVHHVVCLIQPGVMQQACKNLESQTVAQVPSSGCCFKSAPLQPLQHHGSKQSLPRRSKINFVSGFFAIISGAAIDMFKPVMFTKFIPLDFLTLEATQGAPLGSKDLRSTIGHEHESTQGHVHWHKS